MQGHIHKRVQPLANGSTKTTWYVVIELGRDANGKRRQKWHGGYRTRREAEAARAKLVNEVNTGIYAEPTKITLAEWVEGSWLPDDEDPDQGKHVGQLHPYATPARPPVPRPATAAQADLDAAQRLIRRAHGLRLPEGQQDWRAARQDRPPHPHDLAQGAGDAIDAGLLMANPADRAKPPRPRASLPTEMRFWDPEQLARFLKHVHDDRLEAAWHLAANDWHAAR